MGKIKALEMIQLHLETMALSNLVILFFSSFVVLHVTNIQKISAGVVLAEEWQNRDFWNCTQPALDDCLRCCDLKFLECSFVCPFCAIQCERHMEECEGRCNEAHPTEPNLLNF